MQAQNRGAIHGITFFDKISGTNAYYKKGRSRCKMHKAGKKQKDDWKRGRELINAEVEQKS